MVRVAGARPGEVASSRSSPGSRTSSKRGGFLAQVDLAEPVENPDYNKLRRSLGLPTLETIDPAGVRVETLSPARQTRLDTAKMTDEQLVAVYRRAVVVSAPRLLRKIAGEIVSRPSLDKHPQLDKADVEDALGMLQELQISVTIFGRELADLFQRLLDRSAIVEGRAVSELDAIPREDVGESDVIFSAFAEELEELIEYLSSARRG